MSKILVTWFNRYFSDVEAISIVLMLIFGVIAIEMFGYIVGPIILSVVIAYMLAAVVRFLERWHFPRLLAVTLVFILFIGVCLLALLWLLPLLWDEMSNLFAAFPDMVTRGQKLLLEVQTRYPAFISTTKLQQIITGLDLHLASVGKFVWTFSLASIGRIISFVVYLVLVPILIFFFLKDEPVINNWIAKYLPRKRSTLQAMGKEINHKIGSYIKGKILEMVIVFLVAAIIFSLLGLQYAFLLGALVGLSALIPYIGVVVVTIPVVIVALLQWGWTSQFLYLMISYAILIAVDANILVPMLFAEAMNLHPVAIILAIFILGSLGGFWGVFFAIPLTTFLHVLLQLWPKQHRDVNK